MELYIATYFILLIPTAIALLSFLIKAPKLSLYFGGLATILTSTVFFVSFFPPEALSGLHIEFLILERVLPFALVSLLLFNLSLVLINLGKQASHNFFRYFIFGIGIVIINIVGLLKQNQAEYSPEFLNYENLIFSRNMISIMLGALLIAYSVRPHLKELAVLKRKAVAALVFAVGAVGITLLALSFRTHDWEQGVHAHETTERSLKTQLEKAVEAEITNMNLSFSLVTRAKPNDFKAIEDAGVKILYSRSPLLSIHDFSLDGRLNWELKKVDWIGNIDPNSILRKHLAGDMSSASSWISSVATLPSQIIEVAILLTKNGIMDSLLIAQIDYSEIIRDISDGLTSSRITMELASNGDEVFSNKLSSHQHFAPLTQSSAFEAFGLKFNLHTHPLLKAQSLYISNGPRLFLLIGLSGCFLLAYIIFMYSSLSVSYEEIEKMVKQKTSDLEIAKKKSEDANISKTMFLANMSHEIRTPLNILLGASDLLSETNLDSNQQNYVRMFRQSGKNLLRLVEDIIDMSKIESGLVELNTAPLNLHSFIEELTSLYRIKSEEKGLHIYSFMRDVPQDWVLGDHLRLKQIIGNVISNAIKYTDKGAITITVTQTGGNTIFRIADTGGGISENQYESIFERFNRGEQSKLRKIGGAGLGLSIARDLVQRLGGEITVSSKVGIGSEFVVSLPLVAANPVENKAKDIAMAQNEVDRLSGLSVLLVDDSSENRHLIKLFLKKYNVELQEAENGQIAVEKFHLHHFDMVLMDMQMPIMDGYEATKKIRTYEKCEGMERVPIIAVTAHALKEDNEKCLSVGCDAYVSKPISRDALVGQISALLFHS